jgi:hypothetical protein
MIDTLHQHIYTLPAFDSAPKVFDGVFRLTNSLFQSLDSQVIGILITFLRDLLCNVADILIRQHFQALGYNAVLNQFFANDFFIALFLPKFFPIFYSSEKNK